MSIVGERIKGLREGLRLSQKGLAEEQSVANSTPIKALLQNALTNKIDDREVFMKGVDYSYYYEQDTEIKGDGGE